jgi:hypothetical protein
VGETHRINKSTQVQEHSVEDHDAGGLERVAVDDVAAGYGVPDLDSGGDWSTRNLVREGFAKREKKTYIKRKPPVLPSSGRICQC